MLYLGGGKLSTFHPPLKTHSPAVAAAVVAPALQSDETLGPRGQPLWMTQNKLRVEFWPLKHGKVELTAHN